jgi:hypothetical protein
MLTSPVDRRLVVAVDEAEAELVVGFCRAGHAAGTLVSAEPQVSVGCCVMA